MHDVLLAEDEPVSRCFLHDALESLGYRCQTVGDGGTALACATTRRFDLLLLDVNLPELHGPDVLSRLRQNADAASQRAPAIALTADNEPGVAQRLLAAGFAAVGSKPIEVHRLAALLTSVLRGHVPTTASGRALAPWDDAAALSAAGGNQAIVTALRELMLKELPAQRDAIVSALEQGDAAAARHVLHRLRAACGFCGAAELSDAVDFLGRELDRGDPARTVLARVLSAIQGLLPDDSGRPT